MAGGALYAVAIPALSALIGVSISNPQPGDVLAYNGTQWVNTAGYVTSARRVDTTSPLTGGGDLSANRTLGFDFSTNNTWTGINSWSGANTQTAGSLTFSNNVAAIFGTGKSIYSDGSNLIVDGGGTTPVSIGPTSGGISTGQLLVDFIGLSSPTSNLFWVNFSKTTPLGRGALNFSFTYTGVGPTLNIFSVLRYQGSNNNVIALSCWNQAYLGSNPSGANNTVGQRSTIGFDSTSATQTLTAGCTVKFFGLWIDWSGNGGTHTNATIQRYGLRISAFPALTLAGATDVFWGINSGADIQVYDDIPVIFGGNDVTKGNNYLIYTAGAGEMHWYIGGGLQITVGAGTLGFFGFGAAGQYAATGTYYPLVAPGGAGEKFYTDSFADGGIGGSSYCFDDVILCLKSYSLLAA